MIVLDQAKKVVTLHGRKKTILSPTSLHIPSNRCIALLTPSDDDKKILIDLLAGFVLPSSGRVIRKVHVSFPVGYLGGFDAQLSVRHNVAHVARLYDADIPTVVGFVERVADFGKAFDMPFRELAPVRKTQLSHIVAYGIPFDFYLLNAEPTRAPKEFKETTCALYEARARTCGMLIATRNLRFARDYCNMFLVLDRGQLLLFEDFELAVSRMERMQVDVIKKRRQSR